jgi:hypothetical protein
MVTGFLSVELVNVSFAAAKATGDSRKRQIKTMKNDITNFILLVANETTLVSMSQSSDIALAPWWMERTPVCVTICEAFLGVVAPVGALTPPEDLRGGKMDRAK